MDINELIRKIKQGKMLECYSHAVLYENRKSGVYDIFFVDKGRDINITISSLLNLGYKIKEVYNYNKDIKLCDRLDNVSDLMNTNEKFRTKYVNETQEIISYLLKNRKLSKTQYRIILAIIYKLQNILSKTEYENIRTEARKNAYTMVKVKIRQI